MSSAKAILAKAKRGRRRKYGNRVTFSADGRKFDSLKECKRYEDLKLLERAGEIQGLELQPAYAFEICGEPVIFDSGRQLTYRADFRYKVNGQVIVEDTKGFKTDVYKIKRALMKAIYGIEVRET